MSRKPNDLTNNRFEKLVVKERVYRESKTGNAYWKCICDCGAEVTVRSSHLISGSVKSCGCLRKENVVERSKTHGMSASPEYNSWRAMIKRCYDKNNVAYSRYGGAGITVCDEWRDSFEAFYRDMGHKPTPEHSIEREKNDQGYYKENCKWATKIEQANNRKNSLFFEHNNERRTLPEWCLVLELNYHLVRRRIYDGWSFEEAIFPMRSINITFEGATQPLHFWCDFLDLKYQTTYNRIMQGESLENIALE